MSKKLTNKDDENKLKYHLIEVSFLENMAAVMTYGISKYEEGSWKNTDNKHDRNYDACIRHLVAWRKGNKLDDESGLPHLAHAAFNLMALMYDDEQGGNKC